MMQRVSLKGWSLRHRILVRRWLVVIGSLFALTGFWAIWPVLFTPWTAHAQVEVRNPYQGDPKAIEEGRVVFQRLCIFCHGSGGRGAKGPDLTDDFWRWGGRDADIFATIAAGRLGTQMGAFASRLNTDEIWQVIAYIRSQYRDTLVKAKEKGGLTVCVASDNLPFSDKNPKPTGFEVELAEEIVRRLELRSQYFWVDTRKGLDRALGNSLLQKRCDFFMGIPSGKATGKKFEDIIFTKPYFGTGYILTIRQQSSNTHKLEDLKRMKMAVPRGSVADEYLVHRGYEPALYNNTKEALEAIQKEEVEVALLWAPEAGWWIKKHPDSSIKLVEGYIPEPELRWNFTIALREVDHNLKEAIDQVLDTLIKEEQVKKILVKYGVPFYPPFE